MSTSDGDSKYRLVLPALSARDGAYSTIAMYNT